jgi:hypothetical protein
MKSEVRTINKHGITFLGLHFRNDALLNLREPIFFRYSLFDLSKIYVYSTKGEFICIAKQVEKVHPMANYLGTISDMEQYRNKIQKQRRQKNKVIKEFKKYFPTDDIEVLEIPKEEVIINVKEQPLPKIKKLSAREEQMNVPIFQNSYEKYEWLMKNGCTNQQDRKWLADYIRSDEYESLYGD